MDIVKLGESYHLQVGRSRMFSTPSYSYRIRMDEVNGLKASDEVSSPTLLYEYIIPASPLRRRISRKAFCIEIGQTTSSSIPYIAAVSAPRISMVWESSKLLDIHACHTYL
jgi:hypothetical protein